MSNEQTQLALRLPYSTAIQENFGVDINTWKVLVEAVWPEAQATESVIMALSYCKARNLDPLKRVVHIVPIWNKAKGKMVDTVWPGIAEARTTAARTKSYAGRDMTLFGPDMTKQWTCEKGEVVTVTFPDWAQVTVYRLVGGQRVAFAGPQTYWMETYASKKDGSPNAMWQKRPRGQLDKCAERAALAAAFPEELGDDYTEADGPGVYQHMESNVDAPKLGIQQPKRLSEKPPETQATFEKAKSQPESASSDEEHQIELANICSELAGAELTVKADAQYKTFALEAAFEGSDPGELADTICVELSSFFSDKDKKIVSGKKANELTGKWLNSTLRRAKDLAASRQPGGES